MTPHRFVALSVTTIPVPASTDGTHPPDSLLTALGMMVAVTFNHEKWYFQRAATAIVAGAGEGQLLNWLADRLPIPAILIGWQLDTHVIPALINAASTALPDAAHDTMIQLARCLRTEPVDLAHAFGGAAARDRVAVATDHCVAMPIMTPEERFSAWSTGDVARLRAHAADEALGLWWLFLKTSGSSGLEAESATYDWLIANSPRQRDSQKCFFHTKNTGQ